VARTSTFVFTSGSATQSVSSVSTQAGVSTVSVNGVSLKATCRLEPEGLSVVVQGFDGADQNGTQMHNRLLLKPGEHRVTTVQRAFGQPPAHFTITRIGNGIQISANGT
jgi:hypothetical protein